MAVEIKTMDVKNEDEQSTIEFWGKFAWSLKSSQRIFNQSSHLESRSDGIYEVTNTTDYTKLVFERDKNMSNYDRITELEQQYLELSEKLPTRRFDNLESYARYFSSDYRNGGAKAVMIAVRIALVVAALLTISEEAIFVILLIAFVLTFAVGSYLKHKAFEENVADSESRVCKAYGNYLKDLDAIDTISDELCVLV